MKDCVRSNSAAFFQSTRFVSCKTSSASAALRTSVKMKAYRDRCARVTSAMNAAGGGTKLRGSSIDQLVHDACRQAALEVFGDRHPDGRYQRLPDIRKREVLAQEVPL